MTDKKTDRSIIDQFVEVSEKNVDSAIALIGDKCGPADFSKSTVKDILIAGKTERLRREFRNVCPPEYDNTDISRITRGKIDSMEDAFATGKGVYIHGIPGTYKSRLMWMGLAREFAKGHGICLLNGYELPEMMSLPSEMLRERICKATEADLLYIDDIFKSNATGAQENMLFGILERRFSDMKPVYMTSNVSPDRISDYFTSTGSEVRSSAIMRRIQEFCVVMEFC